MSHAKWVAVVSASLLLIAAAPAPAPAPSAAPVAPAAGTTVTIPGGTHLQVVPVDKVSSATANVGDTFAVQASQDVSVDGWVVIKKGAAGQGEVATVNPAGSHGSAGSLGVQLDWIYGVDGEKIKLTSQKNTQEGQGEKGKSSTVTIVSWALLGIPGLFAHNFVKGHDIELTAEHPLDGYVFDTVHIVSSEKAAADPGFAH